MSTTSSHLTVACAAKAPKACDSPVSAPARQEIASRGYQVPHLGVQSRVSYTNYVQL